MYDELIAELRQHHCDAKEDDTQEVCEECAYDVIIADESVPSGIASVCACGLMNRAADAIEELSKLIDHDKTNNRVDNLEWVTPQENTDHEIRSGTNKTRNSQLRSNSKYREGKVQLTFLVSAEENNRLEEMGLRSGWSRTRIIREALHRYLEAEEGE